MYHYSPLHPQAVAAHHSDYSKRLALWHELLMMEKRLREIADESTDDARVATRLDRGADEIEQAANHLKERMEVEE